MNSTFKILGIQYALITIVHLLTPQEFGARNWIIYGLSFPLLLLLFEKKVFTSESIFIPSKMKTSILSLLRLGLVTLPIFFIVSSHQNIIFFIKFGLLAGLIQCAIHFFNACESEDLNFRYISNYLVSQKSVLIFLFWTISSTIFWWDEFQHQLHNQPILILILILLIPLTYKSLHKSFSNSTLKSIIIDCLFILVLYWRTTKMDATLSYNSIHHWGPLTGPAQAVREGGWLLWDVPSQYGFLSILTIATLPFESVYDSLYWVNAMCFCVSVSVVYLYLRSTFHGVFSPLLAFLLCYSVTIFIPGWQVGGEGPIYYPMVGGFRFLWVYLLLGLYWKYHRNPNLYINKTFLFLGSSFWLMGVLWSAESAFFVTCLWLIPILKISLSLNKNRSNQTVGIVWLLIPISALLLTSLLILSYYLYYLDHAPDILAYFDHAISFYKGFGSSPINSSGSILLLLSIYAFIIAMSVDLDRMKESKSANSVFTLAMCFWSVTSYYISRSHDNNIANIFPLLIIVLAGVVRETEKFEITGSFAKQIFIPISIISVIIGINNFKLDNTNSIEPLINMKKNVTSLLPSYSEEEENAFTHLGLEDTMALYVSGKPLGIDLPLNHKSTDTGAVKEFKNPQWIPSPLSILIPLRMERREIYFERFIKRKGLSGSILFDQSIPDPKIDWLYPILSKTHTLIRNDTYGSWRIQEYKIKN